MNQSMLVTALQSSEYSVNNTLTNTHGFASVIPVQQQLVTQPSWEFVNVNNVQFSELAPVNSATIDIQTKKKELIAKAKWKDKEYRQAYAEAAVEQGIAWQVRINRERRGLTQKQLADTIGTRQSSISRMEDPEYGAHSLQQLVKVAHSFDCALIVKFASYSTLARESRSLSEDHLYAQSFSEEILGE
ncbi:helix-turn-helix transcriptional regulator [Metallibacterium sp.]|uniref:helix-turn-helix transcriptional regulator n=1 Tax=Metallibacterium sp. TaxID=2940281 RepID=UPI002612F533|nr:helix-turn-helix transcriptional regulator [Metallibacterium sp.]